MKLKLKTATAGELRKKKIFKVALFYKLHFILVKICPASVLMSYVFRQFIKQLLNIRKLFTVTGLFHVFIFINYC